MPQKDSNYLCYLLRLWRDGEPAPWRASLEAPGDSEIKTFASMAILVEFLETRTGEYIDRQPDEGKDQESEDKERQSRADFERRDERCGQKFQWDRAYHLQPRRPD